MRIELHILAALALAMDASCAPPDTLAQMRADGIRVEVPLNAAVLEDPSQAALRVAIEYDGEPAPVTRAECVTLGADVRAEAGGLALSFDERGRWQEADGLFGCDASGCGVCVAPRMSRPAGDDDATSPETIVLADDTHTIALEVEGLFAARTITRTSPATARVGSDVALEYSRPEDTLDALDATFVGTGQGGACDASVAIAVAPESDGTGRYGFVLAPPASTDASLCAGPWSGTLRLSVSPRFEVPSCQGTERCTVVGNAPLEVEQPFTIVP